MVFAMKIIADCAYVAWAKGLKCLNFLAAEVFCIRRVGMAHVPEPPWSPTGFTAQLRSYAVLLKHNSVRYA